MGRRFQHDDDREIEMPVRDRLERTPDFPPFVTVEMEPMWQALLRRDPALHGPALRVYILHEYTEHTTCPGHEVQRCDDRFGAATCEHCGAAMWSPWWVADGLYGLTAALASDPTVDIVILGDGDPEEDGTAAWIAETEAHWQEAALKGTTPRWPRC